MIIDDLDYTPYHSAVQPQKPRSIGERLRGLFGKKQASEANGDPEAETNEPTIDEIEPVDFGPQLIAARALLGAEPSFAVFHAGTTVFSREGATEESLKEIVQTEGEFEIGTPTADYFVAVLESDETSGFVVRFHCQEIFTFIPFSECSREVPLHVVGNLCRGARALDAKLLNVLAFSPGTTPNGH